MILGNLSLSKFPIDGNTSITCNAFDSFSIKLSQASDGSGATETTVHLSTIQNSDQIVSQPLL